MATRALSHASEKATQKTYSEKKKDTEKHTKKIFHSHNTFLICVCAPLVMFDILHWFVDFSCVSHILSYRSCVGVNVLYTSFEVLRMNHFRLQTSSDKCEYLT